MNSLTQNSSAYLRDIRFALITDKGFYQIINRVLGKYTSSVH